MSDKYYRGLRNILNDTKHKLQLASMTLKINENRNSISGIKNDISEINNFSDKIDTNTSSISTNLGKINTNTSNISDNSDLINTNTSSISNISEFILKSDKDFEKTYNVESKTFRFNKDNHHFIILEKEIEHDFIKNSLLFVKNNIHYKYDDLSNDYHRCQHEYSIYDDSNNLIYKYLFNKDTYYNKNSDILNTNEEFCIFLKQDYNKIKIVLELHRHNRHGVGNINLEIDNNNNYIKVDYIERGFLDNLHLVNLNTGSISTNSGKIDKNASDISDNLSKIDKNISSISTNLGKINTNTSSISTNLGKINTNTSSISTNSGLINTNTSKITSNLEKINKLQTSNIKAFYNLDQIFIYDIQNGYQNVDKNNHFHIFEKEIIYNFTKNSYLEIALKVLTEVSHYMLIGYFQILCNFYDQDNTLFYTISLSTAMGSINKLSTVKSVFIAPINENMSKIKIDFFIAPKETQENRSAKFTIQDINSNKIYVKYFQKTDEMSIKDIQDALDSVKNINLGQINTNKTDIASNLSKIGANTIDITNNLSKIESLRKFIYLKNTYFTDFDSTDELNRRELLRFDNNTTNIVRGLHAMIHYKKLEYNIKKDDFIEVEYKLILNHSTYDHAKDLILIYELFQEADESTNTEHKTLCKTVYRYNQFNEMIHNKRISAYAKLCYKVKSDITKFSLRVYIEALSSVRNTDLIVNHDVIRNGANYIFFKHYGN